MRSTGCSRRKLAQCDTRLSMNAGCHCTDRLRAAAATARTEEARHDENGCRRCDEVDPIEATVLQVERGRRCCRQLTSTPDFSGRVVRMDGRFSICRDMCVRCSDNLFRISASACSTRRTFLLSRHPRAIGEEGCSQADVKEAKSVRSMEKYCSSVLWRQYYYYCCGCH